MAERRKLKAAQKKRRIRELYDAWAAENTGRVYKLQAFFTLYEGTMIVDRPRPMFEKIEMVADRLLIRLEQIVPKVHVDGYRLEIRDYDGAVLHLAQGALPKLQPGQAFGWTVHLGESY